MRADVYAAVVTKLSKTRVGDNRRKWQAGTEAYVCNSHYEGFQGPTRKNPGVIPTLFKWPPHEFFTPPPKRQCHVLERSPLQDEENQRLSKIPHTLVGLSSRVLADAVHIARTVPNLKAHIDILKREVEALQGQPQRLNISLLTSEQLHFYTGLQPALFHVLLNWLKPVFMDVQLQGKYVPARTYSYWLAETSIGLNAHP
jgi:hypothetical protein